MSALSKEQQLAEAKARAEGGADPAADIAALDTVDADGAPLDPGTDRRAAPADPAAPERQQPPTRGPFDRRRADIVSRFRTERVTEADAARDDISDFQRSGLPPEFEPIAQPRIDAAAEDDQPEPEAPAPAEPAPPPKVKLKVNGVEREATIDEIIALAQRAAASDDILGDAKKLRDELGAIVTDARTTVRRPDQPGHHAGEAPGHHAGGAEAQPEPAPAADQSPNQDDEIDALLEELAFGTDREKARTLLSNVVERRAATVAERVVENTLANDALRDQGARGQQALVDFLGDAKNADIATDPMARAAIEVKMYEQQRADIVALGIDPDQLPTAHGGKPTPGDIAQAHLWYRSKRFKVSSVQDMLTNAVKDFRDWKGTKPLAADPAPPPAPAAAPRVDITVDRAARRQSAPLQPARTAVPQRQPSAPAPAAPRDRSAIVEQMKLRTKGLPRRGGAAVPAA